MSLLTENYNHSSISLVERSGSIEQIKKVLSDTINGRGSCISLSGKSGTGKTTLVKQFLNQNKEDEVLFSYGKFGQFGNSHPYAALIQSIEQLTDMILLEPDHVFSEYQSEFKSALGDNGGVISNLIPKFNSIIGVQEKPLLLGAIETRNRFFNVIDRIYQVFLKSNKTLVIFFDDLQWADVASLDLIQHLLTSIWSKRVLFIISFRSDEIQNNLALKNFCSSLDDLSISSKIELANFSANDISKYISNCFLQPVQHQDKLVNFIMQVTGGNPLYVNHYINNQIQDEKLRLNKSKNIWEWVLYDDSLTNKSITDFLDTSLERLEKEEIEFLQYGFCLRERFCLKELSVVSGFDSKDIEIIASKLEDRGLIVCENNNYNFSHDRILRSVKDISTEKKLVQYQLTIARVLLKSLTHEELDSRKEEIVDYLNEAHPSLNKRELEYTLSVNEIAFEKSMLNGAYNKALLFSLKSLEAFDRLHDGDNGDARFTYLLNVSRSYYLNTKFDLARIFVNEAFKNTTSFINELKAYSVFKDIVISESGYYEEVLSKGRELLAKIDIKIPSNKGSVINAIAETQDNIDTILNSKNISSLINNKDLKDKTIQAVIVLLNDLWEAAYYAGDELIMHYLILNNVEISLKNGNSSESAFGYVIAGMLETLQGNYNKAYDLGELALNLVDKYNDKIMLPKVTNLFCNYISPYKNPFGYSASLYQTSSIVGKNNGDYLFGLWATMFEIWSRFLSGENLTQVLNTAKESEKFVLQTNDTKIIYVYTVLIDILNLLVGKDKNKKELRNYGDYIEYWQQDNFLPGISWLNILLGQYHCVFGDFEKAHSLFTQEGLNTSPSIIMFPYSQYIFYSAYSAIRVIKNNDIDYKDSSIDIDSHIEIINSWRRSSPNNFEYQYYLLQAEKNVVLGKYWDALQLFNKAISSSEKYNNNYAMAYSHEMKADFLMGSDDLIAGTFHLQLASNYYEEWGCFKKSRSFSSRKKSFTNASKNTAAHHNETHENQLINFDEIINFNKILSQEFNKDIIIGEALDIVINITHSDKGVLVTKENEIFSLKAISDKKTGFAIRHFNDDISTTNNIPVSLLRYVTRSKKYLHIDNINFTDNHYDKEYFSKVTANSILCLPVVHKGEVQLIIYLESADVSMDYNEALINTVNMLLYQLHSSLNNAQLYTSLTEESKKLKDTADKLEVSENRFSVSTKYSDVGVWEWNILTNQLYWSEMVAPMFGAGSEEIDTSYENFINFIHPDDKNKVEKSIQLCFDGDEYNNVEHRVIWEDGTIRWVQESGDITRDKNGKPIKMLGTIRDITEYKENQDARIKLEMQLQQAQKMEALGQLTGGIAHDFNNILGVVIGYSELLKKEISNLNNINMSSHIEQIISSSQRAAHLVEQMLSFSRINNTEVAVIDSIPIIKETIKMLSSTIPSSVEINSKLDNVPYINFNSVQLNQILMNICINAQHAMGEKGIIDIATHHHKHIQKNCSSCHKNFSGEYIEVSIADTGEGIPLDVLDDIFNPFFTTKDVGQGTGMGLSMVHGILHTHDGHICVETTPKKGSTFRMFLPASLKKPTLEAEMVTNVVDHKQSHRVLIVDDEPGIVGFLKEMLSTHNYQIKTFTNSTEALQEIKENLTNYDCIITDQTMPKITGFDLAKEAKIINPEFPIIICTGYSDFLDEKMTQKAGIKLLKKPISTSSLLNELNNALSSS